MPLFCRVTTRESFERYCTGLLTDLPHKTCSGGITAAVAGTTTERLWAPAHRCRLGCAGAPGRERMRQMIEASPAGGVLAIDDTTFPKQGRHSVGVARQHAAASWASRPTTRRSPKAEYIAEEPAVSARPMHWPVSPRLFLPDGWISDKERRRRAHVPTEVRKQSKPEITLDLIDRARESCTRVGRSIPARHRRCGLRALPLGFFEGLEARELLYACAVKTGFGASAAPRKSR